MTIVSQAYHLPRTITTYRTLRVDAIEVGNMTAQRNWPERCLQGELREFLVYVKMQLDLLRGAKTTQSSPSNAIQGVLRRN